MGFCSTLLSQSGAARTRRRSWWSRARLVQAVAAVRSAALASRPAPVSPSAAALTVFLTRDIPKLAASPAAAQAKRRSPLLHRRPRPTSFVQRPRPAPTAAGSVAGDGDLRVGLSEAAGLAHRGPGAGTRTPAVLSSTSSGGLPAPALRCARTAGERGGQPTSESVRSGWRERDTEGLHGAEVLLRRPRGGWLVAMHVFDEMTHRREQGKDGW